MTDTSAASVLSSRNEVPILRETLDDFVRETGYTHYPVFPK